MELPYEVASATDALLAALRETEPFRTCAALRESVMEDEVSRRLLERFTRAEAALRMAAGSADPFGIIVPVWIASFTALFAAVLFMKLVIRFKGAKK